MSSTTWPSAFRVLASLIPGFDVPDEAQPSCFVGYILIVISLLTTTFPKHNSWLKYLRLAFVPFTIYALFDFAFAGKYEPEKLKRIVPMGMGMLAIYGSLKSVEIGVIGFFNAPDDWPTWVSLEKNPDTGKRDVIPCDQTLFGRLTWAYDLLSVRGSSWFRGRVWSFAPPAILNQPPIALPQPQWIATSLFKFFEVYLVLDALETVIATKPWTSMTENPVTSLSSLPHQFVYAFCVCCHTCVSITIPYVFWALVTGLVGAPSTAWPPMFDSPFASTSLAEFWSVKWHAIFRRVFSEWSRGILGVLQVPTSSRAGKFIRALTIFSLSYLFHCLLLVPIPQDHTKFPPSTLLNMQGAKFFLSQPLGLALELFVVNPIARALPSLTLGRELKRLYSWAWLLWSGRFWADVWYSHGMLEYEERYILVSPIRGLLWGTWIP